MPATGFTFEAYRRVISQGNLMVWFTNSVVVAIHRCLEQLPVAVHRDKQPRI